MDAERIVYKNIKAAYSDCDRDIALADKIINDGSIDLSQEHHLILLAALESFKHNARAARDKKIVPLLHIL